MKVIFWLSKGVVKHRNIKLFCFAVLLITLGQLQAQETHDKWYGMVNINEGYRINETSEWSTPGLSYELYYRISNSFGLQSKTGFLFWKDADMDSYFTMIGVHYKLFNTGVFDVLAYGNAGTSAIIGNDYASFFGIVESGLKLLPTKHKSFNASISWNQNTVFYEPTISYLAVSAGYVF